MGTDYSAATVESSSQHRRWIRGWLVAHADEHRDPQTEEINLTSLVEDWDRCCADGGVTLDPDHPAWSIAVSLRAGV